MNVTDTIENRIKSFKASSFFTAGDPYSFSVPLGDGFSLPGKYDPRDYLSQMTMGLEGKSILVVCPANSGLCLEAIHAGASTVVGFEPRHLYHRPMSAIAEFADEIVGATFIHRTGDANLIEKFDVVIWAEGVDDIPHPKSIFDKVFDALAPGGRFYLELATGTHGVLPSTTNCWKPTVEAVKATVESYGEFEIVATSAGRNQTRKIFTIVNNERVRVEALAESDYTTMDDVKELADKIKASLPASDTDLDIKASTPKKIVPEESLDSVYDHSVVGTKEASTADSSSETDNPVVAQTPKANKKTKKGKSKP